MLEEVSLTVDGHPVTLVVELGDSLPRGLRAAGHTLPEGRDLADQHGSLLSLPSDTAIIGAQMI